LTLAAAGPNTPLDRCGAAVALWRIPAVPDTRPPAVMSREGTASTIRDDTARVRRVTDFTLSGLVHCATLRGA